MKFRAGVSGGSSGSWEPLVFLDGQFCTCYFKKIYDFHNILGGKLMFFSTWNHSILCHCASPVFNDMEVRRLQSGEVTQTRLKVMG